MFVYRAVQLLTQFRQLGVSAGRMFSSKHTPWFFSKRAFASRFFPTEHLKIEPWFTNGWQSYGRFKQPPWLRSAIPMGGPNGWAVRSSGISTLWVEGYVETRRGPYPLFTTDDQHRSQVLRQTRRGSLIRQPFSLTGPTMGCEHGGGVSCAGKLREGVRSRVFSGLHALQNRLWFDNDKLWA